MYIYLSNKTKIDIIIVLSYIHIIIYLLYLINNCIMELDNISTADSSDV
jgi:hypothetical protein